MVKHIYRNLLNIILITLFQQSFCVSVSTKFDIYNFIDKSNFTVHFLVKEPFNELFPH